MTDPKPAPEPEAPEQRKPQLRPLQVTASALAAVTGAFLASRLGVYGTIAGVGVVSVLSTVIGEFYLRSLERTRMAASYATLAAKVRVVRSAGADEIDTVVLPDRAAWPADGAPTVVEGTAGDDTVVDGTAVDGTAVDALTVEDGTVVDPAMGPTTPGVGEEAAHTRAAASGLLSRFREFGRLRWSAVAAGSVAACILAVLAITGIEALTGSKLSGGEGRTFAGLVVSDDDDPGEENEPQDEPGQPGDDGQPGGEVPQDPATTPTPTPTDPTSTPTPTPTDEPEPGQPPAEDESPEVEVPGDGDGGEQAEGDGS